MYFDKKCLFDAKQKFGQQFVVVIIEKNGT